MFADPSAVFNMFRRCVLAWMRVAAAARQPSRVAAWNVDATLAKDIKISERIGLQSRCSSPMSLITSSRTIHETTARII